MNGQVLENPLVSPFRAFRASGVVFLLLLAASVSFFVSPLLVIAALGAAAALWIVVRYPMNSLGLVLAFMPIDFMAIALGKFFGLPYMTLVSVCTKEIPLVLIAAILWWRNGFKPTAPDWWLLACLALAFVRTLFAGTMFSLWTDLNFVFAYFLGRIAVLTHAQEQVWAKCAVWIAATLSVLGMLELFVFGEGPRTLLYLALDTGGTERGALSSSFRGLGFTGLREAATMVGPNGFGALCMIALVVWWVYCKNPIPAGMVAAGLICSVTRADWLGAIAAILFLAIIMGQKKRLYRYSLLALALFAISIPVLGLSDFLFFTKTGQDPSAEGHQEQIVGGLQYAAEHPLGGGNTKFSPVAILNDSSVTVFETTYPYIAAAYGIPVGLCLVGFLISAFRALWRKQSQLANAAAGILLGIGVVMIFTLPLDDRRLALWAFFPLGLAVRSCMNRTDAKATVTQEIPATGAA
jgi:hypothetical protein